MKIKKDEIMLIPIYIMHRSEAVWENAHIFDPDRFLHDPSLARKSKKFVPFGAGPKVCIGMGFAMMELASVLIELVRKFQIEIDPQCKPKPVVNGSLVPEHVIPVHLSLRE